MQKISFILAICLATFTLASCQQKQATSQSDEEKMITTPSDDGEKMATTTMSNTDLIIPEKIKPIRKPPQEWKAELTDLEYQVLREAGTERAFTGDLLKNKEEGTYTCRGCQLPLFSSKTKFESGTGWPSFYQPLEAKLIEEKEDRKFGMSRTEILCARCAGHLGHVFPDGPKPTGLRYCLNAVSLDFVAQKEGEQP